MAFVKVCRISELIETVLCEVGDCNSAEILEHINKLWLECREYDDTLFEMKDLALVLGCPLYLDVFYCHYAAELWCLRHPSKTRPILMLQMGHETWKLHSDNCTSFRTMLYMLRYMMLNAPYANESEPHQIVVYAMADMEQILLKANATTREQFRTYTPLFADDSRLAQHEASWLYHESREEIGAALEQMVKARLIVVSNQRWALSPSLAKHKLDGHFETGIVDIYT